MRRILLAGVSLTVTACALSTSPPPSAVSSKSTTASPYVLALSGNAGQCSLWREVAGQRQCLDGTPTQLAGKEPPPVAAPRMAVTAQPLDAPKPVAGATPIAMPPAADPTAQQGSLFDEMKRIGMIKGEAPPVAAAASADLPRLPDPSRAPAPAATRTATTPVAATPDLPALPKAAPGVITAAAPAAGGKALAFAATDTPSAPAARNATPPRVSSVVTQSWAAVEPPQLAPTTSAPIQLAASTPQAHDTVGRAPVTAVEKAALPTVRSNTVVPLKITERATEDRPAVVTPAVAVQAAPVKPVSPQLAQGATAQSPSLPSLPALPPLPSASAPSQPATPTVTTVTSAPAPPPAAPTRIAPVAAPALPPAPVAPVATAEPPAKAPPLARAFASSTPTAKPVPVSTAAMQARAVPKSAAAKPNAGRYLVLQSFQERDRADRLAERYRNVDAKVASVTIKGQTWHRVVVRDGATERNRLASDGVRGFWPVTL